MAKRRGLLALAGATAATAAAIAAFAAAVPRPGICVRAIGRDRTGCARRNGRSVRAVLRQRRSSGRPSLGARPCGRATSRVGTRTTRAPRAIRNRSKAPDTCRQSSSAHTRTRPRPRAHCNTWSNPRADRRRLVVEHFARRRGDSGNRVRALVHVRTEHDRQLRPLLLAVEADGRRTRPAGGAATLLSSHAGHPRPATSDTTKGSQAHRPTASKRVSSPPVGTFSTAPDAPTTPIHNSKPQSGSRPPQCSKGERSS